LNRTGFAIGIIIFLFVSSSFAALSNKQAQASVDTKKSKTLNKAPTSSDPMDSPWPMFCHDARHTGRSPYAVYGNTLYEKWKIQLHNFVRASSPSIAPDGTIYIGTWDGALHAVNPNGTEKWMFKTDYWMTEMTTPAIDKNGIIYVGSDDENLYALYPNGTEKWRCSLNGSIFSSPAISQDGTIFIGAYEKIYAINPNGTILWENTTGWAIKASPAIGGDGSIYVASHDGYFYSFFPSNGTLKWKLEIAHSLSCYSSPAIDDNGTIYYGTRADFYAINPNGTIKWIQEVGGLYGFEGGPVIGYDGTIYAAGDEKLWAFNQDGSVKWSISMGDDSDYASPAITKNGMIYAVKGRDEGSGSDTVCLVSPEGTIVSSVTLVSDFPYDTVELSSSLSIGADGTVYLGSWFVSADGDVGYLHAIGTIQDEPPATPIISGPLEGKIRIPYEFSMQTNDPDQDDVAYYIDWGDDTTTITGLNLSGKQIIVSHTWTTEGTYDIKVKAIDIYGAESDWATLIVTMPSSYKPIPQFLEWLFERFPNASPLLHQLMKD
jgi:outer membrane protein assembly factor BamB